MISITICDDEPGTCSDIENIILNYTHSHAIETVIEIFYSGETLYESMEKGYRTDLLFLDIQLFEMNGVEVGKKIEIHSQNDVIEYYSGMKEVEKQVIGKGFLAIHKSYIVNTMFISAYHYESVKITDGTVLPVSQKYRKKMKSYLLELL